MVLELGVKASGVKEKENRGERGTLRHTSGDTMGKCRLPVKVEASRAAVEEATHPPDDPEGEPLKLEGME
jgi:hypothetical protein